MKDLKIAALTVDVVANYLSANRLEPDALPDLIRTIYSGLSDAEAKSGAPEHVGRLHPAIPIKKALTESSIACLECGKVQKSLKRHLMAAHALTPENNRVKWGLAKDYPMVSAAYAALRSAAAKAMGLGQGGRRGRRSKSEAS